MNDIVKSTEGGAGSDGDELQPVELPESDGLLRPIDSDFDPNAGVGDRDLLNPANLPQTEKPAESVPETVAPEKTGGDLLGGGIGRIEPKKVRAEDLEPRIDTKPAGEEHREPKIDPEAIGAGMPAEAAPVAAPDDEDEEEDEGWTVHQSERSMDDPLLGCLTILCTLLDRPFSSDALTAGLPMVDGQMTPELFVRAAERAGISARLMRRRVNSLTRISLPCVLLLNGRRACVLTEMHRGGCRGDHSARDGLGLSACATERARQGLCRLCPFRAAGLPVRFTGYGNAGK